MHHGRLHFHVPARIEKPSQLANDLRPPQENLSRPFVHNQVEVPPPVALVHVREPMPLFRQRQQCFGEQLELLDPHGQLIRLGPEQMT